MPSFIRPTYKIVMEEFSSWRPCLGCFHSSRRSSPTADIKDRNLRKRLQKFCRISTLKSSNAPIGSADLWSCPNAGSIGAFDDFNVEMRQNFCRSEEHTSELQSHSDLVCRLLLEKKKTHV